MNLSAFFCKKKKKKNIKNILGGLQPPQNRPDDTTASRPPSILLSPLLHLYSSLSSFVLAPSLARPCGRAFEGSISNTSKGFLAACSSSSIYAHSVFLLYMPCLFIHAHPYICSLLFRANILLLSVRNHSLRRCSIPHYTIQWSERTAPSVLGTQCVF